MDDYNARRLEREEGLKEGEAIGLAKGKSEGLVEGKADATKEIALNMLQEGEPMEKIVKFTGLSVDEIQKIKNNK